MRDHAPHGAALTSLLPVFCFGPEAFRRFALTMKVDWPLFGLRAFMLFCLAAVAYGLWDGYYSLAIGSAIGFLQPAIVCFPYWLTGKYWWNGNPWERRNKGRRPR